MILVELVWQEALRDELSRAAATMLVSRPVLAAYVVDAVCLSQQGRRPVSRHAALALIFALAETCVGPEFVRDVEPAKWLALRGLLIRRCGDVERIIAETGDAAMRFKHAEAHLHLARYLAVEGEVLLEDASALAVFDIAWILANGSWRITAATRRLARTG